MKWIKKLFTKKDGSLNKPVVSGDFKEWYLEYRNEMAKAYDVNYDISIASWTFSENHEKYFIKGLSPKEAVLEYIAEKNAN